MKKRSFIARVATSLAGAILVVYGIIAALSPLPAGLPLVVLGLIMIGGANPAARPFIRRLRRRWSWFDRLVAFAGKRGPETVQEVVRETRPVAAQKEEDGA